MHWRLTLLLALGVALALLAGGCGGGGGEDRTADLTPEEIVAQAGAALAAADSYAVVLDAAVEIDAEPGATLPGGLGVLPSELAIEGAGAVSNPDRASLDLSADVGGLPLQLALTRVGDELFLSVLGQELQLDLEPAQVAAVTPEGIVSTLTDLIAAPQRAGDEEIDGTDTVRVDGGVDPERAGTLLEDVPAEQRAPIARALGDATVSVWVGKEDLLPRRVRIAADVADVPGAIEAIRGLGVEVSLDLSDFGEQFEIQAPANARRLTPEDIGGLLGGRAGLP